MDHPIGLIPQFHRTHSTLLYGSTNYYNGKNELCHYTVHFSFLNFSLLDLSRPNFHFQTFFCLICFLSCVWKRSYLFYLWLCPPRSLKSLVISSSQSLASRQSSMTLGEQAFMATQTALDTPSYTAAVPLRSCI